MSLIQEFDVAGTRVNVSEMQRTTREEFIKRFLPQLVFFSDIPLADRETELGSLWDVCNPLPDSPEEVIEPTEEEAIKQTENANSKRAPRKMGKNAIEPGSDSGSN